MGRRTLSLVTFKKEKKKNESSLVFLFEVGSTTYLYDVQGSTLLSPAWIYFIFLRLSWKKKKNKMYSRGVSLSISLGCMSNYSFCLLHSLLSGFSFFRVLYPPNIYWFPFLCFYKSKLFYFKTSFLISFKTKLRWKTDPNTQIGSS